MWSMVISFLCVLAVTWPVDWSLLDLAWVIVTRVLFSWVMSMDLYSTQLFCIIWTTTDLKYLIILVEHNKLIKNFRYFILKATSYAQAHSVYIYSVKMEINNYLYNYLWDDNFSLYIVKLREKLQINIITSLCYIALSHN